MPKKTIEVVAPVADEDDEGKAVAEFVGTRGCARSVGAGQFVQEPV